MTTTEIRPALTSEEWEHWQPLTADDLDPTGQVEQYGRPHALAARVLYGQPFGFTHDDVAMLRRVTRFHRVDIDETLPDGTVRRYEALSELADRIAALLPPIDQG